MITLLLSPATGVKQLTSLAEKHMFSSTGVTPNGLQEELHEKQFPSQSKGPVVFIVNVVVTPDPLNGHVTSEHGSGVGFGASNGLKNSGTEAHKQKTLNTKRLNRTSAFKF